MTIEKRDLFTDLMQGIGDLQAEREGKLTLKNTMMIDAPAPEFAPERIRALRESLGLSQAVFASAIRTNVRTYQKWEQGNQSKPNDQARLLLGLIEKDPSVLEKLASV